MRIDLNYGPQSISDSSRASAQTTATASSPASSTLGEDQAQLSGAHVQVAALAAQASSQPEVREARVQALRAAVESGQYHASAENIAGAVMAHMLSGPPA